jgi:hypothetical protein
LTGKYWVLAVLLLLLAWVPAASSTTGSYAPPADANTSGPLVSQVVFSVCTDEATCGSLLTGGSIQAAELPFSIGSWTSLCPPPQGTGANSNVICGTTSSYAWVGLSFDHAKFPGNDEHFRRAMQFLQDYPYIQGTILRSVQGQTTNQPDPCFAYVAACNPVPMTTHYGSGQNLVAAGEELEQVANLFCDNGGVPCVGTYSPTSEWCVGGLGTGSGCGAFKLFTPYLFYRSNLFRNYWGAAVLAWGSSIGLQIMGAGPGGGGGAANNCLGPRSEDVIAPGVYNPATNYNSLPVWNSTAVAADYCDMLTYGFIASGPDLESDLLGYNSQTAGTGGVSTGNVFDDQATTSPPDTVAGYASWVPHLTVNNLDYDTNSVEFATTAAQAYGAAQDFMDAYALQIPTVIGYYLNTLYVDNANGWTSFVQAPVTGPNELAGLRYTLLNAHQCGAATCTLGAPDGGVTGGTLSVAIDEAPACPPVEWACEDGTPSQDVWQNVYDTPLITPPSHLADQFYYVDYLTSSHNVTNLPGSRVLGIGGTWYYFQEPCAGLIPAWTFAARLAACQGRSGPYQAPGPLQHGIGLTRSERTIQNGQVITLNFRHGLTFYDGALVFADDYVFSLNLLDVAGSPNLPDSISPTASTLAGPLGLIAARTLNAYGGPCSARCPTVQLYIGSQSFWNLADVVVPVMPAHVWKYFNPDHVATAAFGSVDATRPFGIAASAFSTQGAPRPSATAWIYYLNNLEIGTGPYYLSSWNGGAGMGVIAANPFYFNPNWKAEANMTRLAGASTTMTAELIIDIYNPTARNIDCGPAAPGPILPGTTGLCQMTNADSGTRVNIYDASGTLWRSLRLERTRLTGAYSWTVPGPSTPATRYGAPCHQLSSTCYTMPAGQYYAVLWTGYYFRGLGRVWSQVFGFTIA